VRCTRAGSGTERKGIGRQRKGKTFVNAHQRIFAKERLPHLSKRGEKNEESEENCEKGTRQREMKVDIFNPPIENHLNCI